MRYKWTMERGNGSLERTLVYALNRGSDDYNAAINYLNGNTAAGARFDYCFPALALTVLKWTVR